jgi:hypothetical protein
MLFSPLVYPPRRKKIRRVERQVVILYLCGLPGVAEGFESDLMREVVVYSDVLSTVY